MGDVPDLSLMWYEHLAPYDVRELKLDEAGRLVRLRLTVSPRVDIATCDVRIVKRSLDIQPGLRQPPREHAVIVAISWATIPNVFPIVGIGSPLQVIVARQDVWYYRDGYIGYLHRPGAFEPQYIDSVLYRLGKLVDGSSRTWSNYGGGMVDAIMDDLKQEQGRDMFGTAR